MELKLPFPDINDPTLSNRAWRMLFTLHDREQWEAMTQPYLVVTSPSGALLKSPFPGRRAVVVRQSNPET